MISLPFRRRRPPARTFVAGCLLLAWPSAAHARPEVVATRGVPSSIASEYGRAVNRGDPAVAGLYVVPTRWGIEVRDAAFGGEAPVGLFRTAGVVDAVSVDGSSAYLFAGTRGIIVVDLSDPANPAAIGSRSDLGDVVLGAASPNGYGLAATTGPELHFLARANPGQLSLLATLRFTDGRTLTHIRARADSFLVVSSRPTPLPRLFVTLYRLRAGALAPETLREIPVSLQSPTDLAWLGDFAFVGAGNSGVIVADVPGGSHAITPLPANRYVRALDGNDSVLVAVTTPSGLVTLRRAGSRGEQLVDPTVESLTLEPFHVTLSGSRVLIPSKDATPPQEPDEVGWSAIEFQDLDGPSPFPPVGGTGRTRRVAWHGGLAYVADYTGGLRIYRAGGSDTSLVGILPPPPNGRAVDIALDAAHGRAFLALGSPGLWIVDITDPAAPSALATFPLSEQASAVAVVDSSLVVVGRRGASAAGVTFVDVTIPTSPVPRGQVGVGFIPDPRAIAVKDTVAFVADASVGLTVVGFGNRDAPNVIAAATGFAAHDVDLSGNLLLVGTRSQGLQIFDVFRPALPSLLSEIRTPAIRGVARSGSSAVLLMGEAGTAVVDLGNPGAPVIRGPIAVPGIPRDAAWVGDTLLVTSGYALERFLVSPAAVAVPALTIEVDPGLLPRARIAWAPVSLAGIAGLDLYRDASPGPGSSIDPAGVRVNASLMSPSETEAVDDDLIAGVPVRYRLEAFFADGSSRKVAEGSAFISSATGLGRPFPNPFRPGSGRVVTIPFRLAAGAGSGVELSVFDVAGRLVRRIRQASPAAGGFGSVGWDGRNGDGRRVAEGVYFLRLSGQGIDDARRIILLR